MSWRKKREEEWKIDKEKNVDKRKENVSDNVEKGKSLNEKKDWIKFYEKGLKVEKKEQ